MQQSKVDAIVNKMIDEATDRGDGFILDLLKNADGEDGFGRIEVRAAVLDPDEYQRMSDGRQHTICDTASFIRYAKKYGHENRSLIFYNQDGATLTIDEELESGEREIVSIDFAKSAEWEQWDALMDDGLMHRQLFGYINKLSNTIMEPEILLAIRKMKMNVHVVHDSDIQEDEKTIGILIKSTKGEDLKKFPKTFNIKVPVLEQDVIDESQWIEATIRLEIDLPDTPTGSCTFTLSCPEWRMLLRSRVLKEGEAIRSELEEFTIIHGYNKTFLRRLGLKANGMLDVVPC